MKGLRTLLPYRYKHPNNEKTKVVKGTTMTWCSNDCHEKPMWCGRTNCLNRADCAVRMKKQRERERENKSSDEDSSKPDGGNFSEDFKIALAATIPSADLESLESQFMASN